MPGPAPGGPDGGGPLDVVCLGESMVTFVPTTPGPLADVPSFDRAIGGAESNVACTLARAGHRVRWVSRVGADGFGDHLLAAIAASGVDVGAVQRDPHLPTGIYFRTAGERSQTLSAEPGRGEVVYYRKGSAAAAMAPGLIRDEDVYAGRVLHLTGITGALSPTCRDLLHRLTARTPGRPLVSFDVNHRPALWHGQDPLLLAEFARGCDIVFVGEDEAQAAWGLPDADAVRAALPEPAVLVVKQGALGATAFASAGAAAATGTGAAETQGNDLVGYGSSGSTTAGATASGLPAPGRTASGAAADPRGTGPAASGRTASGFGVHPDGTGPAGSGSAVPGRASDVRLHVPAPVVDVVAHVGAGDAFAAGFLSATLRGLPLRDRLRHGHLMAAAALTVPGDLAEPPARDRADALVALDDEAWAALHLAPGWTTGEAG
ncbi:sugar kinase [Actinacidiphila guanduensis]|uniref:2-dehydro-3-deoxygluconokinase n=1 Tax=Actinacidiphila guanduensis TaxID=310781 RepID=A0A1H0ADL5_9ACTN|nr:sugar kinase [Actinacidiphila guanduensis]SDN31659.1 2-dehydro-3-deoxygluconokinase [Actinacidiphila guanduensis]